MKKYNVYRLFSYLGAFNLGCYFVSQFKFNEPIALYRWGLTILFFTYFTIAADAEHE